jgi:hypothetical protein
MNYHDRLPIWSIFRSIQCSRLYTTCKNGKDYVVYERKVQPAAERKRGGLLGAFVVVICGYMQLQCFLNQEEAVDENVKIGSNGEDAGILVYPEGELKGEREHVEYEDQQSNSDQGGNGMSARNFMPERRDTEETKVTAAVWQA